MNFKSKLLMPLVALGLFSCSHKTENADYNVIPLPNSITKIEGYNFELNRETKIVYPEGDKELERVAGFLSEYVEQSTGYKLETASGTDGKNTIVLKNDLQSDNKEEYDITVGESGIIVRGASPAGVFYGVQTLRKSIPAVAEGVAIEFPQAEIKDFPRFGYRGMMLDVARHFFTVDSVKRYIDLLALHNMNKFHWHLTDDQGWRIEMKKFPELTKVGAYRDETVVGHSDSGVYDGKPYGGFYTQDEIREIVKYAQDRFVTIIPEIDLPGHNQAALTTYPNLGCTGGPYKVRSQWGISDDVLCVGNDSTIQFVKDMLSEIIELFPSEYIHIGGDECPKGRWENCPKCQQRIKTEHLKADKHHTAEQQLQCWFMSEIEKFLAEKGRKVIGWDEILEGETSPSATVMSWRGMDGGLKAAQRGNDAIMTPTSHLYFDYYQTKDVENEPFGIGGYIPVERVYNLEPVPSALTDEQKKHIIGVQANLWTEYIATFKHVEYMVLPRMSALAEVQWLQPEKKNYQSFLKRLPRLLAFFDRDGYAYAKHIFGVEAVVKPNTASGTIDITLTTCGDNKIYYTLDGSEPNTSSNVYEKTLQVSKDTKLRACTFINGKQSIVLVRDIEFNKATAKNVTLAYQPSLQYTFDGVQMLVDGIRGGKEYADGRWLGFKGTDFEAVVDMGAPVEASHAALSVNVNVPNWIMNGSKLIVYASDDNKTFKELAQKDFPEVQQSTPVGGVMDEVDFAATTARYFKLVLKNKSLPAWHTGAGQDAFLFVDEIIIR